MKIESLKNMFQQKNKKLLTKKVINSVNKFYGNNFELNNIKAYMLSTVFVDKLMKTVDKYKKILLSICFE